MYAYIYFPARYLVLLLVGHLELGIEAEKIFMKFFENDLD